ncbi:MAG: hypothetical protein KJ726_00665 [Verrucomicrobia bacterium]|nr:hypothetical protein [Verrucomicrobiota bacterium]MBU1908542.1 hypothetical protein [Verrucomicrobiota bacterium]
MFGKRAQNFSNDWKKGRTFFPIIGKAALLALLALPVRAGQPAPLLDTNVSGHLSIALRHLNMTEADLAFAKDHAKPDPVLTDLRRLLSDPLGLPSLADRVTSAARGRGGKVWDLAFSLLEASRTGVPRLPGSDAEPVWPEGLSADLLQALRLFHQTAREAGALAARAVAALEPGDADYLAASFFAGVFNAEDRSEVRAELEAAGFPPELIREVIAESDALDPEPAASNFLARLRSVRLNDLLKAGRLFHKAASRLASAAAGVDDWPKEGLRLDTKLGPIFIGTTSRDEYAERALLILDPGGDDVYSGAAGSADGRADAPLTAIVDLQGNDRYASEGILGPGAALFAVSVLLDLSGDDLYQARYAGQAAAFCGTAWLEDRAGEDTYRAGGFAQAAAFYGAAVLREGGGNDVYDVGLAGQAYAGVLGFALLADKAGNDRYLAGGREPDHERHDDRFLSLAQGFSIGMRPWAGGGVAALVDLAGNDTYAADIYGQGASYWYSVGLLVDGAGNDTYQMYQYGQGAGIHLSLGLLADDKGNDLYTGYILVQGAAHDYGVGMLFDRGGDDTYTADHHAQGRALNNALALLVDSAGDDAYFGRQPDQCQGIGNDGGYRDYGSLAVLLDLAGRDRYTCGAEDGARMKRPDFGIVYDLEEDKGPGELRE